ncbi:tRNA (adenosine(37)-N6)-threonylcarbamoyltransferase complex ATPase subunit type 1 TsaE [Aminobacter sp. NyZ550]|uniref:tRNA (adenosine(37)-N6)-threonylcarbamoyltransferase complex ATPase subunit type 1 TsaE n=1 Tax=Aminobacter sp. NyZ550 TaxID=2979870 RepID=UPI0021D5FFA0|nr:tRNA (adenosine(37)-N6)-threonylcarbamoyltransferase complex ATPase subunit type 1 TsaE [Aminobacter sp. NyZ550]WAX95968.1 tRNA (adenosine(37)-N6)-threonylcarbamoyltransferase complex ATPase subunit type 1 TsaE [Aminobacter sp. NyZ550]
MTTARSLERHLPDEAATTQLGEDLAMAVRPGDVFLLDGDLGAGKSTLARGLIRALAADPAHEVPSPTFTLVQSYDTPVAVHHFDLYRLSSPEELEELGFDEAVSSGVALVEWPERATDAMPATSLRIAFQHEGDGRRITITGDGPAFDRVARSLAMRDFLVASACSDAHRARFIGDASARSYETVTREGHAPLVLMNSPRLTLGPPVRDGKPYAEIAHTAQTVAAFAAIDRALAAGGVTVPGIVAQDLDQGFVLLEHLGSGAFLDPEGRPVTERYAAAAELLAMIHGKHWDDRLEAAPGVVHQVPPFDRDALMIEVELLVEWYVKAVTGAPASAELCDGYRTAWNAVFDRLADKQHGLVLRDYHSPNIIWRSDRHGHDRLGIVDFQDALIGPVAYDVASLAMDARVTVSPDIERSTVDAYVAARNKTGDFDEASFREAYAIMAAQRNSKILGIFVRLDRRDGKPQYLRHLPRIRDYLQRALSHPALAELRDFYRENRLLEEF